MATKVKKHCEKLLNVKKILLLSVAFLLAIKAGIIFGDLFYN